eukprot:10057-Heterococcus_DN1.PRE.1
MALYLASAELAKWHPQLINCGNLWAMTIRKRWIVVVGMGALLFVVRRRRRLRESSRARERRRVLTEQSTKAARASAEEIAASVSDSSSSSSKAASPSKRGSMSSAAGLDHRRSVDIGGVLGMDIGGTLCKLVYFEKKAPPQEGAAEKWERSHDPFESQVAMKRSISLGDLMETHEQKEALQQFYTFMDTPEHYGRSGVRDEHLAYYSHALGGQLHFFRFETRHMDHAIELISGSTIHNTIKALGCTGGGAFKFEDFFLGKLG